VVIAAAPSYEPEAPGAVIRVRQVSVRFGRRSALEQVDLEVRAGELLALAGENGAGKSTLLRCIAGELAPDAGTVAVSGNVAVVWQDLALCDNLDVASNLLLGRETRRLMLSPSRLHATARRLLGELDIPLPDTTQDVRTLSGGQRQLLAVARALRDRPRLLVLDEPTAALGVAETRQVEGMLKGLRDRGVTTILVSHDVEQMFRLADRIVVLRRGRVVGNLRPTDSHPDDLTALITGQEVDSSARRQLDRLHGLVDQLTSADPASSVSLILSALTTALRGARLVLHLVDETGLRAEASLGLPPELRRSWQHLPIGAGGGATGMAAATGHLVVEADSRTDGRTAPWRTGRASYAGRTWAVPVPGPRGPEGVITVIQPDPGPPPRDEVDLVALYAGHVAGALERERLIGELKARNRVLESIRDVLQSLAGPAGERGMDVALRALRSGLEASAVALVDLAGDHGEARVRATVRAAGARPRPHPELVAAAGPAGVYGADGHPRPVPLGDSSALVATFPSPAGTASLLAVWDRGELPEGASALLEDAANSLRLAQEREAAERAHQEAITLRRSQELQRQFLSRLSHELRTPLTAIRGYTSSLLQPDVTWDKDSQRRFLERIAAESARLGRLVGDLLDFSAIETSVLRLQPDWCDLTLVVDAAAACVATPPGTTLETRFGPGLPPLWADHDRLEQVLVNLLDNAIGHNPPGTRVSVEARLQGDHAVVSVTDDGIGAPADLLTAPLGSPPERRSPTAGAGLGMSITRGIVAAHGWRITMDRPGRGTVLSIEIPVEQTRPASSPARQRLVGGR